MLRFIYFVFACLEVLFSGSELKLEYKLNTTAYYQTSSKTGALRMSRVVLIGSVGTLALISLACGYFYFALSLIAGLGIIAYFKTPRHSPKVDPKGKAVFITGKY